MLLELERLRPAVLDGIAKAVQRADARVAAPRENELARAAHPDQLVVDEIRRHAHERELAPLLPDQLVPRGVRDQVREPLERDGVAVAHGALDRITKRNDHEKDLNGGLITSFDRSA